MTLEPNRGQRECFDKLHARYQAAQDSAEKQKWLQALANLSLRVSGSHELQDQYNNEFRDLFDAEPLRRLSKARHLLAPHERTLYDCIWKLADLSQDVQTTAVAGNETALSILQWARQCRTDLLREHEPPTAETAARAHAFQQDIPIRWLERLEPLDWGRTGEFLRRVEKLPTRQAVNDALHFVFVGMERNRGALQAVTGARVRERLRREGIPPETAESVALLLQAAGSAGLDALMTVARMLAKMPPDDLALLRQTSLVIRVCHHAVTEFRPRLKGVLTDVPFQGGGANSSRTVPSTGPLVYWDDAKVACGFADLDPHVVVALAQPDSTSGPAAPSVIPDGFTEALAQARRWAMNRHPQASSAGAGPSPA